MKFAEPELCQITEETWKIVLEAELETPEKRVNAEEIPDAIAACAQIAGDWQLAVVLYCPISIAQHAATVMFDKQLDSVTREDWQDAMCELINIIAGNVKGVLSGSSHLSLPNLVKGQDFKLMFPRHVLLSEADFRFQGQPLLVMLLGEDKLSARLQERAAANGGS